VIKMVSALRHGVLPRTLHVDEPTAQVDWSSGSVRLLTEPVEWPENGRPRRAGVSAFGGSGTNAHVILEQAPSREAVVAEPEPDSGSGRGSRPELDTGQGPDSGRAEGLRAAALVSPVVAWPVSAKTAGALVAQAARLAVYAGIDVSPEDVARSLVETRAVFGHRAVVVGGDRAELVGGLESFVAGVPGANVVAGVVRGDGRVVFVFPGQGSQWVGMASGLLDSSPVFAASIDACGAALSQFVDWSLSGVFRAGPEAGWFDRVDVVQPVLWAVMVSLAELWRSVGVEPAAVVGHSQGEIAAACVAGALSLEDGARVVALRSKAIVALSGLGGMVSVALAVAEVEALIGPYAGRISVAALNGPASTVVSGDADALVDLLAECESVGIRARRVEVDYASHSVHVEALETELADVLAGIVPQTSSVPFYSTLTGGVIDTATLDAGYWYRNLRERVLFAPVVGSLLDAGFGLFVEASAHPVLTMGIAECAEAAGASAVAVGSLRREDGGPERFLVSVAEAWAHGASVDWSALTSAGAAIVDLPTYAFQRDRYWLELRTATGVEGWREPSSIGSWRYQVTWRAVEGGSPSARLDGRWLVLVLEDADPGVARWCREALEEHGAKVLVIDGGGLDRDPLAAMLRLAAADGLVGVMALTGLDEGVSARVLVLVQALGDAGVEAPLWCVTQGAVSVGPDDVVAPVQAQVWGLGRVVGLEHPGRWGGLIDLPCSVGGLDGLAGSSKPGEKSGETGASADQVARDFVAVLSGDVGEDQVAIREQGLFARRLSRAPLGELSAEPWRPAGTVLVTGSGRIADRVARWLLDQGAEHVALAGPAKVAGLDRAEVSDLGDRVTVGDLDPADREALAAFLERLAAQGNPVRALVHTAAGTTLAPIVDVTPADLAETFAATVSPAVHALDLLPGIEAAIVFSSVSGVWGTGEHAAFAAANAHLDALAAQQRANGAPITAVSWGIWNTLSPEATGGHDPAEDSSSNSKVAAAAPAAAETEAAEAAITLLARHGTPPLDPDRALEALDQIVRRGESGLVVADVEWGRFTALFGSVRESRLFVEVAGSGGSGFEGSSGAAVGGVRDRLSG
jgi:acyl transferase domain-containing protein